MAPYLVVRDADAALKFYQAAFGFEKKMVVPGPNGKTGHAEMVWHGMVFMFSPEGSPGCPAKSPVTSGVPAPIGIYVYCDDVDALFRRATAAGAKAIKPPQDMFWGDRICQLEDPDGHSWSFGTNIADFDPDKVPKC
jgi:uncharacterized glyoxalase superfamily protein PhnB